MADKKHEGHVLEWIVDHGGTVTLHTCDACVTPERLIQMYAEAIKHVREYMVRVEGLGL